MFRMIFSKPHFPGPGGSAGLLERVRANRLTRDRATQIDQGLRSFVA